MPQLNRKYPSGAAKRKKKAEDNAASSTQDFNSSHVCLVQLCPTQMPYWAKNHVAISTRAAQSMTY